MAMLDLASSDKAVKKTLASERSQNAKSDFEGSFSAEAEKEEDTDWQTMLEVNRKGECIGRITDFEIVLENHSLFKGKLRNNEFKNTWDIGNLPWKSLKPEWTNNDLNQLISWMEKFGMPANPNRISIAVSNVFNNHSYHPVRDYLNSLSWDGEPRVETLFIEYLGAEDTIYTRTVTRKSLVAAVARVFEPGIQFDSVIILVGRQGLGKSTILKKLGKDWFSDNFRSVRDKVSIEQIQGVWIMEISELAGLKKQEVEDVKNYISIRIDRGRMAYGRHVEAFPRQCIFFGSTNHDDFLADPTGNRRFWPIKAEVQSPSKSVFKDFTTYEIDQVWAEAYKLYQKNESLALDKEIARMAQEIQKAHSEIDEKAGLIQDYIDTPLPENWAEMDIIDRRNYLRGDPIQEKGTMVRTRVSIMEIWCECFGKNSPDITKYNSKELNNIMKNTEGWKVAPGGPKRVKNYGMQRCYDRIKVENKSLTRMKALSINHLN
jgi:predicted P-loop ATPase